jgi:uncharacterized protein YfiM (DUF2279 family)
MVRRALAGAVIVVTALSASAQTPDENVQRLRAYHERIATESRRLAARASLADLVGPVMALAAKRSGPNQAVDENRVALMALTLYVNGWSPSMLVPEASGWTEPVRREIGLGGRRDLAQHFIVSAVIAAAAGTPLAAAAGLYKEMSDARDGSGFSFSDLAADRAGEMFGGLATGSDAAARAFQARTAPGVVESDLMPAVDGLPDHLSEAEFTRRFGRVGSPAYNTVIDDITRRVTALPLFRK